MARSRKKGREPFAALLVRLKADLGITDEALAAGCGITPTQIRHYRYGLRVPNLRTAVALSKFCGIPLDQIGACKEFNND